FDWTNHERVRQMLRTEVRKRADCFLLFFVVAVGCARCFGVQLWINCAVSSLQKTLVLLVSFQYRNSEVLAVRRHLRDVDEAELNDQVDLSWALQRDLPIDESIAIGDAGSRKRRVFKLNIDLTVYG